MPREKSCGAIVFKKNKKPEFLLLHYEAGHWGFPKGNQEKGEAEEETVQREVKEETGLSKVKLEKFKEKLTYFYRLKGKTVFKEVVFYLAECLQPKKSVKASWEHTGFKWLPFEKALAQITFENEKKVLRKAYSFLEGRGS